MWTLKSKSSIALIIVIIVMLLLTLLWGAMLAPSILRHFTASELEKIDRITTLEGTVKGFAIQSLTGGTNYKLPIRIEAHARTEEVKENNIVLKVEQKMIRTDTNETLSDFSGNSTYVLNKFTMKNVPDALSSPVNRTGYDPLYPPHLKADENISNVWSESLNTVVTLEFKGKVVEEGVTLYKYFVNKTIIDPKYDLEGLPTSCTLTSIKTFFIEPLSGAFVYTENETFSLITNPEPGSEPQDPLMATLVYLTYRDTTEAKAQGLATAKMAYEGIQLLELYVPMIFGVIAILLTVVLAFNVRRLRRKKSPKPKPQPLPSP